MRNGLMIAITAVGLSLGLSAPPAAAQTAPTEPAAQPAEPTAEVREQARAHFQAGQAAFSAGDFETALAEFTAADGLLPASRALSLIGQCQRKLTRELDALRTFRRYVELYGSPANDRERRGLDEVREWIDEIEENVGRVRVDVAVSGAAVLVDGQVVGNAPLGAPLDLVRGPHTLRAEAEGYRAAEETVTVEPGQEIAVTLVPAPLQTTAAINLSANVSNATATLDGESLGTLPFSGEFEAGSHQLEVTAEGYESVRFAITLEAGQPFTRSVELFPIADEGEAWYEKWWVWTIAAVVVAGATTGIVLGATGGETMPDSDWTVGLP
ncbi:MAG: PEGA domain-containing protein [Deltaproteobacteria bacterium]|nr:PEGA domain-containing protein [Deltaproteobacteria bacterium]